MKQLNKLPLTWLTVIGLSIGFTACNDDFNEEDLLQAQQELADAANANDVEALNQAGNLLDYTVTVLSDDVPIEGASVSATNQAGATATITTDAAGNAVFTDIQLGAHTISISSANHLDVSYLVDFGKAEDGVHYELVNGNVIPKETSEASKIELYALSGIQTAMIRGRVEIETDLTNSTPEVPQNITIRANLDEGGFDGEHSQREEPFGGTTGSIYVAGSFSFTEGDIGSAVVDNTTGEYSIVVPATDEGTDVELLYPLIEVDQTLAFSEVNGEDLGLQVGTQAAIYGPNVSETTPTDNLPGVRAVFSAPDAEGAGFTLGSFAAFGRTFGGSDIDDFPVDVNNDRRVRWSRGAGYQAQPTVTVTGGGATADAQIEADMRWRGVDIALNSGGSGYIVNETVSITIRRKPDDAFIDSFTFTVNAVDGSGAITASNLTAPASGTFWGLDYFSGTFGVTSIEAEQSGTSGTGTGATFTLTYGGEIDELFVTNVGEEYTSEPDIAITGGTPTTAATAVVEEMAFQWTFDVDNSGVATPYVVLPSEIQFIGTDIFGDNFNELDADYVDNNGNIIDNPAFDDDPRALLRVVAGGNIQFDADEFTTLQSGITESFYVNAPSVAVTNTKHEQAEADVLVNADGEITGLNVGNAGTGYSSPVTLTLETLSGLPGSGVAFQLTGFFVNPDDLSSTWDESIIITNGGSGYTDDVNIARELFAGDGSVEVRNGETLILNINYGTGETVEDVN